MMPELQWVKQVRNLLVTPEEEQADVELDQIGPGNLKDGYIQVPTTIDDDAAMKSPILGQNRTEAGARVYQSIR